MAKPTIPVSEQKAISVDQAAQLLGLCKKSLYPYIHSGELASFRVGRRRLIRSDSLESFQKELELRHTNALRGEV